MPWAMGHPRGRTKLPARETAKRGGGDCDQSLAGWRAICEWVLRFGHELLIKTGICVHGRRPNILNNPARGGLGFLF
jgi:hypothetical protein